MTEMVFDRVSCMYMTPAEHAELTARREEMGYQRQLRQGELACPMVISDSLGVQGLQSQVDGRLYDSKSNMRKHYRQSGVIELGNDAPTEKGKVQRDPHAKKKRLDAIGRAFNRVGLPTV